jgi:hypothetical protein
MPVTDLNEAVLQPVEKHALTPEPIDHVINLSERNDLAERQVSLERERKDVLKRIARLTMAIETGDKPAPLVAKIANLDARGRAIDVEIAGCVRSPACLRR